MKPCSSHNTHDEGSDIPREAGAMAAAHYRLSARLSTLKNMMAFVQILELFTTIPANMHGLQRSPYKN